MDRDYDKICRACLTECSDTAASLLEDQVQEAFTKCTNLYVSFNEEDKLPKKLCKPCHTKCIVFLEWKTMCEGNDRLIRAIGEDMEESNKDEALLQELLHNEMLDEEEDQIARDPLTDEAMEVANDAADDPADERSSANLLQMLRKTIFDIPMECPVCSQSCKNSSAFEVHVMKHISKEKPNCPVCQMTFATWYTARSHIYKHTKTPYDCPECDKQYTHRVSYIDHIRSAHADKLQMQPAPETSNSAETFNSRFIRLLLLQGVKCPVCPEYCEDNNTFRSHISSHIDLDIMCPVCRISFKSVGLLKRHIYSHTKRRIYCPHCNEEFKSPISVSDHLRTVHPGAQKPSAGDDALPDRGPNSAEDSDDLEDLKDGGINEDYDNLIKVVALPALPIVKVESESKTARHNCDVCGETFHHLENLNIHMDKKHLNNFSCKICNMPFVLDSEVLSHIKQEHTKETTCMACSKPFRTAPALGTHIRKLHMVQNFQFICNVCERGFTSAKRLREHESMHTDDKQFQCDVCGERFRCRRNQIAHEKTHLKQ